MKKNTITYIVIALIALSGTFYGGIKYGQGNASVLSAGQRGRMAGQFRNGGANKGGFLNGEILSKDDKSIIIKLRDGGSKIIFLSATTSVNKMAEGTVSDLEVGKQVTAIGAPNSDGSITATSIQLTPPKPANPTPETPTTPPTNTHVTP